MQFSIINGSERPAGNSDRLCEYIENLLVGHGVTAERIDLRQYKIELCGTCGECNTRIAPCTVPDDMPELVSKLFPAAGIIYVVPVHGFGPSALMQTFIERAGVGYLRFNRPLENKVGGAVIIGRRYGLVPVYTQILNNLLLNRMIVVGSGYPVTLQGGSPGKALTDDEGMASVTGMITRMTAMAQLLKGIPDVNRLLSTGTINERQASAGLFRAAAAKEVLT